MVYESFYQGKKSTLDSPEGSMFQGQHIKFSRIGQTTNPMIPTQLAELNQKLNEGMRVIEAGALSNQIFESIPEEHFKEMNRLSKLTNSEVTFHAPLVDPTGFTDKGWSPENRERVEKQIEGFLEKAHKLNSDGNTLVTLHATSGLPSYLPYGKNEKDTDKFYIVDTFSGEIKSQRRETMFNSKENKEFLKSPQEQLSEINKKIISENLNQLAYYQQLGERDIHASFGLIHPILDKLDSGKLREEQLLPEQREALHAFNVGKAHLESVKDSLDSLYQVVKSNIQVKDKESLKKLDSIKKNMYYLKNEKLIESDPLKASNVLANTFQDFRDLSTKSELNRFQTTEDFALQQTKKTIASAVLNTYKKFGDKSPILCIENVFPGTVFSRGADLKKLIQESRQEFINEAKKQGISEDKAKKTAEKLIGATWDVGHINQLKSHGFGNEEIIKDTKEIASYIKHVHLTDNFGSEDSHLVPGMGNVPFKEIFKELEKVKYGGKEIVEAGGFISQFKMSPTPYILDSLGSPIYQQAGDNWNQIEEYRTQGVYSMGYGLMLPEQHFSMYGSGFSSLPSELGGRMPGKGQRFSGAPME